jgi:hypothetical protein
MLFDSDLRYTLVDGTGLAEVGLSPEGMEGKTIWEVFPPEMCAQIEPQYRAALETSGYPSAADPDQVNRPMTVLLLVILMIYVTMVYGPIAAFLVELFPTRIRYTSMSLPYHIGNGWFGGFLPFIAAALVVKSGDIYYGLWYPIVVAATAGVIGLLFVRETKDVEIRR